MNTSIRTGLTIVCISSCIYQIGCTPAADRQDVEAVGLEISERLNMHSLALEQQDMEKALQLYTSDAIVRPANTEPVQGHEALRVFLQQWWATMAVKDVQYTTVELDLYDDKAYQIGTYTAVQQIPGQEEVADRGSFMIVWERQNDGSWRYMRGIFNSSLPVSETIVDKGQ